MSGKTFVDTNVLVYAHDATMGAKHERAREVIEELWYSAKGVLSTQVLQEFCINVRRKVKHPLSLPDTRRVVEDYLTWEVVVNDGASIVRAIEIEERYHVSFWDALILQSAEAADVDILLSEDLSDGQQYGNMRVKNPFTS